MGCLAVSLVHLSLYPTKSSSSFSSHVFLFFSVMSFTTHCSDLDHSLPHGNFNFCFMFQNLRQSLQSCNIATSCWSLVCQGIFPCILVSGNLWTLVFVVSDFCDHPFYKHWFSTRPHDWLVSYHHSPAIVQTASSPIKLRLSIARRDWLQFLWSETPLQKFSLFYASKKCFCVLLKMNIYVFCTSEGAFENESWWLW